MVGIILKLMNPNILKKLTTIMFHNPFSCKTTIAQLKETFEVVSKTN